MSGLFGDLDLPDAHELARRQDAITSHEAAEHIVESGKLGNMMADALRRVAATPDQTASELDPAGIGSRIAKRLNDLRKKGYVTWGEPRKCTVTGRNAHTWRQS